MGKTGQWLERAYGSLADIIIGERIPKHRLPRPKRNFKLEDKLPIYPYQRWFKLLYHPGEKVREIRNRLH